MAFRKCVTAQFYDCVSPRKVLQQSARLIFRQMDSSRNSPGSKSDAARERDKARRTWLIVRHVKCVLLARRRWYRERRRSRNIISTNIVSVIVIYLRVSVFVRVFARIISMRTWFPWCFCVSWSFCRATEERWSIRQKIVGDVPRRQFVFGKLRFIAFLIFSSFFFFASRYTREE